MARTASAPHAAQRCPNTLDRNHLLHLYPETSTQGRHGRDRGPSRGRPALLPEWVRAAPANAPSCRLRQARCSACPTQGWVVSHEPWSAASRLSRDRRSCWFCIDKNRKAYTEMTKSPGAHRDEVSAGAFLVSGSIQGIRLLCVPQVFFQRPHGSCQNFEFPMGAIRQDLRHFSFKTGPCLLRCRRVYRQR